MSKLMLAITACMISCLSFAEPMTVAFLYEHPVNAGGWSQSHEQARLEVSEYFGEQIKTTTVEGVRPGPDTVRTLTNLARRKQNMIFATSFGHMNPVIQVARRFPAVTFNHASGYSLATNVGTYQIRAYQGRYLSGMLAAGMTESKVLGYVAAFPIPEVIRGINAFTLGVQAVDPEIRVRVIWINTWMDAAKEREAAELLIDAGVDVITHHTETPAIMLAAEAAGIWAIGYQFDRSEYAPNRHLVTVAHNWTPLYKRMIQNKLAGTWQSEAIWLGLNHQATVLASMSDQVPAGLQNRIESHQRQIASGERAVFAGPLRATSGELMVKEQETLDDEALIAMEWFVEGVINPQ